MEDFFKKHNFNPEQLNKRNRRFHIVRYYPKIQTYEFLNVGILLYDEGQVLYRLLHAEEIAKLHCPSLVESKVLKNSLDSLDEYLQERMGLETVLESISNRYKNILDTSFQLVYSGNEPAEVLCNKLFHDYVGYKFEIEAKESPIERIIKQTEEIVLSDYKKQIVVKRSKVKGFNLDFMNTKTEQIHHSLLGSIENSSDVARAFLNVPSFFGANERYDFLNTRHLLSASGQESRSKLEKLSVNVFEYTNDRIDEYLKSLV